MRDVMRRFMMRSFTETHFAPQQIAGQPLHDLEARDSNDFARLQP
jgi:hypothetical protein